MLKKSIKTRKQNLKKKLLASSLLAVYITTVTPSALCQVIPDGRTGTSVDPDTHAANVFNVTTTTTKGINAFNSFSKFNISSGTTVNLHLGGATNLINLINDTEQSSINGTLNSIKNGKAGGNVYLLNPYGVIVGESGKINVGSLNIFTPAQSEMDKILDTSGEIDDQAVSNLLNNEIPVTASGVITVRGKINAIKDVNLQAGEVGINGDVLSAAAFQSANIAFDDVVNTNEFNNQNLDLVTENGKIVIKAVNEVEISGKVVTDGSNNLNAGTIDISSGKTITATTGTIISAKGKGTNSQGGAISLKAENNKIFHNTEAELVNTQISLVGATIQGGSVSVLASSETTNSAGIGLEEPVFKKDLTNAGILNYTGSADYLNANSKAEVIIGNGSQIISDSTISLESSSKSNVNLKSYEAGVTYGESSSIALTKVTDGASLSAQGDIEIKSLSDNKLTLEVVSPISGDPSKNINAAVSNANSDSQSFIESGVNVTGSNIKIGAFNNSDVRTQAAPPVGYTGLSGVAVALSDVQNNARAYIGSDLITNGNIDISAYSSSKNITRSKTNGAADSHNAIYNNLSNDINSLLGRKLTGTEGRDNALTSILDNIPGSIQLSSALSYSKTVNDVNSYINDGANIKAGNININSLDIDLFQVAASSKAGTAGNLGGVFAFGDYANNVNAYIGNNAVVDSKHDLNISSEIILPYRTDFDLSMPNLSLGWPDLSLYWPNIKLQLPEIDFSLPEISFGLNFNIDLELPDFGLPDLNTQLGFDAEVSEGYLSSYADSKNSDSTIAGSINVTTINNQSSAYVGNNAQVNTDRSFAASDQNIDISAKTRLDKINYTGIGRKGSETNGAGGSYGGFDYNNDISTYIGDNSSVYSTGDIILDAKSEEKIINLTRAGSSTGKYAVIGAISDNHVNNTVYSYIKGSSDVHTGGDLNVSALDDLWALNIAGGIVSKSNIGAGISISNNDINQDIASFIGKKSNELSSGIKGNIQANNVNLSAATDNDLYSLSLAGATGSGTGGGKFGAGLSGDASLNNVNSRIWSYINDDVDITANADIILNSDSESSILALSGGAAIGGSSAGIAGSYSDNNITLNTGVSAENTKLSAGGKINLISDTAGKIKSASIGAAKASSVGVAGSVAFNDISSNSDSSIQNNVTVVNANNLDVNSSSDLKIYSVAGGVAVAGSVGAGAAYVNNNIDNITKAKVGNSSINADNVNVSALSRETIKSVSAAGGVAKTAGIAGSIALNNINSTTESFIDDNATVTSAGSVIVTADNVNSDKDIESYAGTLAGGLSVGVGGTVAANKVEKTTIAHVDNGAEVNAGNNVEVAANSGGNILVKTGNVGVGLIGVTATISANVIKNTTDAHVENADITSGNNGSININAIENSKIDSFKVAAAAGKVGVGASGDVNVINNQVSSRVGGTLEAGKDIQVLADSTETIDSNSYAFSGGFGALAGSISASSIGSGIGDVDNNSIPSKLVTEISNGIGAVSDLAGLDIDLTDNATRGLVIASVSDDAKLTSTAGDITIKANDIADLNVKAGGYSLGVVAVGGSIAVGSTGNRVNSLIGNGADLMANSGYVNIHAISDEDSTVNSYGGSNGVAAIAGSVAQLSTDKVTNVSTGTGASIEGNNVDLKSYSNNDYDIKAEGAAGGVINVAGSYAESNLKNNTSVTMNSAITAGNTTNIISLADNNIYQFAESTAGKERNLSDLASDLFSGDLLSLLDPDNWFTSVLSVGGGVSSISFDNDSAVNIGNSAKIISADTDLIVGNSGNSSIVMQAISNNYINSGTTTNCTAKAVALAASVSRVDHWTDSSIAVDDNAVIAGKTVAMTAQNNIDGSSEAIANVNPADANIDDLVNKIAELLITNFLLGKLNGAINVSGLKSAFEDLIDDLDAGDIAWDIFWHGDFGAIPRLVENIKNIANDQISAFDDYKIDSLPGDAVDYFKSTIMDTLEVTDAFMGILPSLYGDSSSISKFDLKQANSHININSDAQILSKDSLSLKAENNEITNGIYSGSESIISNNIFGNTNAESYTTVNSDANVTIADNTLIESSNISVYSDSNIQNAGYVNTSSRGTAFDVVSGDLTKAFNLNFFDDVVSSILKSPVISWTEDVPVLNWIGVVIGWVTETFTETVNIASECGSILNSVTKYAGINDTFNLLRYQDNANRYIVLNQNSNAALNGDINILGASQRILTVKADGSIDLSSNFIPTVSDVITVKNSLESSKLGIYVPNGTVTGNATLTNVLFYAPTTIKNYSTKDLVIQDLNLPASGSADISLTAKTNNFRYQINADSETKFGDSTLEVDNPNSNLIFLGEIGAPITDITVSSRGNISGTNSVLVGKNISLTSLNGNISGLKMYLTNLGNVNIQSNGLVNIGISGINYLPAEFGNYYGNQIININSLSAAGGINFSADGSLARHYTVNSGQGLIIASQASSNGAMNLNSVTAGSDIDISSINNNLNINTISSTTGNISISAQNGSITDANNNDTANILGQDITLTSTNGNIGQADNYLDIREAGVLNANATNDIYLKETTGDLDINQVISNNGSIGLHVVNGNASVDHISASDKIDIIVDGNTLNIGTIDPTELSLKVSNENGQIKINEGFVSEKATLIADNIEAKFTDTNPANPLNLNITGNDGIMADYVDLNVKTSILNSDIFNADKSIIASGTDNLNMKWVNVGKNMSIESPGRNILVYNDTNHLSDANIQLYSPNEPFSLITYHNSLVKTDAYITNYDNSQILNNINTENSIIKASYKNTTKIQYVVEDKLNPLDMSTMAKNQRNNIRWDINTSGSIKFYNGETSNVKITNISSGGAGIESQKDIPLGEELQVNISYNGLEINAKAKVIRKTFDKETGKYDLGLMYTEIDDSIRKLIPYACMSVNAL